jgi:hypothetical protein
MSISDWIAIIGISTGLMVTTISGFLLLAFRIGAVNEKIIRMETTLERIPWIELTLAQLLVKVEVLWQDNMAKSNSPITLNEAGLRALKESNIGEFAACVLRNSLDSEKTSKNL